MLNIFLIIISQLAFSNSINWSGNYRFENVYVSNFDLDSQSKDYFLHHLVLKPHIVASDGMHIKGRFDVLNSKDARYANVNNQIGSYLGRSPSNGNQDNDLNSKALNNSQEVSYLNVSQLYLHWVQEYGSLIVGRAPKDFGLGINYSAGDGLWDHWLNTHDVVAYQVVWGNIYITPFFAKVEEVAAGQGSRDTQEVGFKVHYENPETDLKMGAYYEERQNSAGLEPNAASEVFGGDPTKDYQGYNHRNWNLYVEKKYDKFGFGLEIGFNSGSTGVINASGEKIDIDAFAVVTEMHYDHNEKWQFQFNAGMLTGDDPQTTNTYEGYLANRNYNIAMLMFNHPMGKLSYSNTDYSTAYTAADVDSDRLSNAMYFAPGFVYYWKDKWHLRGSFIYADLMEKPRAAGTAGSTELGYEVDLGLSYKPSDRVEVRFDAAYFSAGEAFKGGANNFPAKSIYGFESGVAVSF